MTFRWACMAFALATGAAATGCAPGASSSSAGSAPAAPQITLAPAVHLSSRTTATTPAGTFARVARDGTSPALYLLAPTDISPSRTPIDLRAAGSTVTLEGTFQPAAGDATIHGYGFKFLTDASAATPTVKRGYAVLFEQPNRLDIYRESDGKYTDIVDYRATVAVAGRSAHRLRVVVTRSNPSRIDIVSFLDGRPATTAHDARDVYTEGTWGPTNVSNTSIASVTLRRPVTANAAPPTTAASPKP